MPWFAVPVTWTLQETVLVEAATQKAAADLATARATGQRDACDTATWEVHQDLIEALVEPPPDNTTFHVRWEIDLLADDAYDAATQALAIQRRLSTATVFTVRTPIGQSHTVDLAANCLQPTLQFRDVTVLNTVLALLHFRGHVYREPCRALSLMPQMDDSWHVWADADTYQELCAVLEQLPEDTFWEVPALPATTPSD